jgi:membrane protease YdiL (CAAX protease family)
MAWKCPQCGQINNNSLIRCFCGNEVTEQEQELLRVDIVVSHPQENKINNIEFPFLKLKVRTLLLWLLIISIAIGVLMEILEKLVNVKFAKEIKASISFAVIEIVFIALVLWKSSKYGLNIRKLIGFPSVSHGIWKPVTIVIPLMFFSIGAMWLLYYLLSFYAPTFTLNYENTIPYKFQGETAKILFSLKIIIIILIGPIVEELFFRGFLLNRWTVKWNIRRAIFTSSLIFCLFHDNIIGTFVVGIVMSTLYIKTRTLVIPIICHILNNTVATALTIPSLLSRKGFVIYTANGFPLLGSYCFCTRIGHKRMNMHPTSYKRKHL